jgi:hypothetical protein
MEEERAPAQRGRAHARAPGRACVSRHRPASLADGRISRQSAGIVAPDDRRDGQVRRRVGRQVLEAVHADVHAALAQRLLELLGEEALPSTCESGRSWMRSPSVLMTSIANGSPVRAWIASPTKRVCVIASALPRLPKRIMGRRLRCGP